MAERFDCTVTSRARKLTPVALLPTVKLPVAAVLSRMNAVPLACRLMTDEPAKTGFTAVEVGASVSVLARMLVAPV